MAKKREKEKPEITCEFSLRQLAIIMWVMQTHFIVSCLTGFLESAVESFESCFEDMPERDKLIKYKESADQIHKLSRELQDELESEVSDLHDRFSKNKTNKAPPR